MTRQPLRLAIAEGERVLADAGVSSPRVDAELLAAHVLGIERTKLPMIPLVDPPVVDALGKLIAARASRIPLQHLTGWAAVGATTVAVGPGVFVPRPETEILLQWAVEQIQQRDAPLVVDLCSGSGAIALALANVRPDAVVYAVEQDQVALSWLRRNADAHVEAGNTRVHLVAGDVGDHDLLTELDGLVDLITCNPPYVPADTAVPPEVAEHDPPQAVFGGADGLAVIRPLIGCVARLLRPGGVLAIEHDEEQSDAVTALLRGRRVLEEVDDHRDLAGRPRFATARRAEAARG
ncbi:MAG: peptide chain release factor N(5)-glutamine methyltransferase [Sciscionella sp.]